MEYRKLSDFTRGWFIGDFEPSLLKTDQFEVALKIYSQNDSEEPHFHGLAIEYNLIVSGSVEMTNILTGETLILYKNEICVVKQGEPIKFTALTNAKVLVIKIPSCKNDKYMVT